MARGDMAWYASPTPGVLRLLTGWRTGFLLSLFRRGVNWLVCATRRRASTRPICGSALPRIVLRGIRTLKQDGWRKTERHNAESATGNASGVFWKTLRNALETTPEIRRGDKPTLTVPRRLSTAVIAGCANDGERSGLRSVAVWCVSAVVSLIQRAWTSIIVNQPRRSTTLPIWRRRAVLLCLKPNSPNATCYVPTATASSTRSLGR